MSKKWALIVWAAVLIYSCWGLLVILQKPGLQYDEALMVLGPVHMLHSRGELTLPHDPGTWFCLKGRCLPLMTVRYVGAIKEYLCLPLFAVFGPSAEIVRMVSMLLGALGILGVGKLIGEHFNAAGGAVAAILIAMNPAYIDLTIFDNGSIAVWMAALGLLCLALSRYLRRCDTKSAFWLGIAAGMGIWARTNVLWLLAAAGCAALIVLGKKFWMPRTHWAMLIGGAVIGGAPFLAYQIHSRGGTWEAVAMFTAPGNLQERLATRWIMFSETLLSDREHRAIWNGPDMPDWERWIFPAIVLAACAVCFTGRSRWARITALTFLFLGGTLFLSKLPVAEHHLIGLMPLAAGMAVMAGGIVQSRYSWGWIASAALATVYLGCALYSNIAAIDGLRKTGGVGQWSDGIVTLTQYMEKHYPNQQIKILDWGLQNNLYVLSNARVHSREIFGDATREHNDAGRPWAEEIRQGGVFLLNGDTNRQFPEPSIGFLQALSISKPPMHRITIPQRSGFAYAEIIDITPTTDGGPAVEHETVNISTGDAGSEKQLEGFHSIENGWRWTKKEFAIAFTLPAGAASRGARLKMTLYIPESSVRDLGAITLTAKIGEYALSPETYRQAGQFVFARDIDGSLLKNGPLVLRFGLDKVLAPSAGDRRELGIIVSSASLEYER